MTTADADHAIAQVLDAHEAAYHPGIACPETQEGRCALARPVESPEARMRDARTDHTFATYLDRTERDQLDARAASAEQERDEALDELRDSRADRKHKSDLLLATARALDMLPGDLVDDTPAVAGRLRAERDNARAEAANLRRELDKANAGRQKLQSELDTMTHVAQSNKRHVAYLTAVIEAIANVEPHIHNGDTTEDNCSPYCPGCRIRTAMNTTIDGSKAGLGSAPPRAQEQPEREEVRWAYRWIGPDGQVYDEMDANDNAIETAEQRAHRIAAKRLTGTVRGEVLRYRVLTMPAEVVATYPAEREG